MKQQLMGFLVTMMLFIGCKKEPQSVTQQPASVKHDIVFSATGKGYSTVLRLQRNDPFKTKPATLDSVFNEGIVYQYKITCAEGEKLLIVVGPGDSKPEVYHYTISDNGKITDDGIISNVAKGSELVLNYLVK